MQLRELRNVLLVALAGATLSCGSVKENPGAEGDGAPPIPDGPSGPDEPDGTPPDTPDESNLQLLSVPPGFVVEGNTYAYRPVHNGVGEAAWTLVDAPPGMEVREGVLTWTPDSEQTVQVGLHGALGDESVFQELEIVVGAKTVRAAEAVSAETGGQLAVDAPLSPIRGAAISVSSGALSSDVELEIAEISAAPEFPNSAGALTPVDFGPDGLVFQHAPTITLPFNTETMVDPAKMGAYVYNEDDGRWEPIEVLAVDVEGGVVIAKASHFSIYAAAETSVDFSLTVEALGADSIAEGRLAARAELGGGLADIDIASVNSLSPEMEALGVSTVAELIAHPSFVGSLRAVRVFKLTDQSGVSSTRVGVVTLNVTSDGATIVITDSFGNVLGASSYDDHRDSLEEVTAHLAGESSHVFFDEGFGASEFSVAGRLHLIYSEYDQSLVGGSEDSLGVATVEVPAGDFGTADTAADGFDVDADGLRGGFDSFDNSLEPKIVSAPTEAVTMMVDGSVTLTAAVVDSNEPPTQSSWSLVAGDASGTLTEVAGDPSARTFSASVSGFYTIRFQAEADGATLETRFNVMVLPPPVVNTAPICLPTALSTTLTEGATGTIFASVDDAETPTDALEIEWGLYFDTGDGSSVFVPSSSIAGDGQVVGFTAHSAGSYTIGCRAFDGELTGEVGTTNIGVVAPETNQAPTDFYLSPASAQAIVGETVRFSAAAFDADGDVLSFSWVHTFGGAASESPDGKTLTVDTTALGAGAYSLLASVSDGEAPPQFLPASLRVLAAPISADPVDADEDGFPEDIDCDDTSASVYPGAFEICGNAIDENCDGVALTSDCDGDGYDAGPDCDDTNAKRHPDAYEFCDGIDNNCDGAIDEDWGVGSACSVGLGVCSNTGQSVCTPDRLGVACQAAPLPSSGETCDELDNDCDGHIDEADICTSEKLGVWMECVDATCSQLRSEGFELGHGNTFRTLKGDGEFFDPTLSLCVHEEGTFEADSETVVVLIAQADGFVTEVVATFELDASDSNISTVRFTDPDTGEERIILSRRVNGVFIGDACPEECQPTGDEVCDGMDNDCDGITDEDGVCDGPCSCDVSVGVCDAAADGSFCSCDPDCFGPPVCEPTGAEVCDGIDNDCNGEFDEGDVCDFTGSSLPIGMWFACKAVGDCTGYGNLGMMFLSGGDASSGDVVFMEPFEGEEWSGTDPYCRDGDAHWSLSGGQLLITFEEDDGSTGTVDLAVSTTANGMRLQGLDPAGEPLDLEMTRVEPNLGGECPGHDDFCEHDDDGDGMLNCDDPCPHNPQPDCSEPVCDSDGVDNNGDGVTDEPGEPCHGGCECDGGPGCDVDPSTGDECYCDFECHGPPPCEPTGSEVCDGEDNDCNGEFDEGGVCDFSASALPVGMWFSCAAVGDCSSFGHLGMMYLESGEVVFMEPHEGEAWNGLDPYCRDGHGEWQFDGSQLIITFVDNGVADSIELAVTETSLGMHLVGVDPDGSPIDMELTRVDPNLGGYCPKDDNYCDHDDDGDGMFNCEDPCPHNPEPDCAPPVCDADGIDNNGDGVTDEPGEPCDSHPICDADGIDNNGDGVTDEPGEPCDSHPICDADGIDNNGDGVTDEPGEPCDFGGCHCDMSSGCDVDTASGGDCYCDPECFGGDPCNYDDDGDGMFNCDDPCPFDPDPACDPCQVDSDGDGIVDCEDFCPHNPDPACDGEPICDADGVDNNGDGVTDEAGEPCHGPPFDECASEVDEAGCLTYAHCVWDGAACHKNDDPCSFDSDGDGHVDCQDLCPHDPNPDCGTHPVCDGDGIDNNGDGVTDEPGEPCDSHPVCDGDGIDNNGDGVTDEPGEPCDQGCYCDVSSSCDVDPDSGGACSCDPACFGGDPCSLDDDGDGMFNCEDPCPFDPDPACAA